jgi:hypothetical protein
MPRAARITLMISLQIMQIILTARSAFSPAGRL